MHAPPFRLRPAAALVALALSSPALAGEDLTRLPLERLLQMRVVAASSYEQSASEAPSAVSVITAAEIRARGYRTLAEALQSLPGLYVTDDLGYAYLGSRGFNRLGDYNSRFQLSVNGLRTNDALFDMAYIGNEFPLDMGLVERIEFAPGPGSSIYGSNAVLGVINVVTYRGAALAGPRIATTVGSDGVREAAASYGRRFDNGVELLASVSGLRSDGQDFRFAEFDAPGTAGGFARGQDGQHARRFYLRAGFGGFEAEAFGGRRDKIVPSIYYGSDFQSTGTRLVDELAVGALRYSRDLTAATRLEARVSAQTYRYHGAYPTVDAPAGNDVAVGQHQGAELRVISTLGHHKLVAGLEGQRDRKLEQRNFNDAGSEFLDRKDDGRRWGFYAQDEFRVNEAWLVNAGLRRDDYRSFGSTDSPRIAVIGTLRPDLTLKLMHGSAFRAPNAYELFYQGTGYEANTGLGPERARSTEAVLEGELGRTRWRASAFHYRISQLIEQVDEDGILVFRNRGAIASRGLEASVTALLPHDARAHGSVSAHDVKDDEGRRVTNAPRFTAKATLEAPFGATGLTGSAGVVVVGPRLDRDRKPVATFATTSFSVSTREAWLGADLSLHVLNAFDRANPAPVSEFFAAPQVPGRGREWRLQMEWRLP